jgi:hypothetical protein
MERKQKNKPYQFKRGDKTQLILEVIQEQAVKTADVLAFFLGTFLSPYYSSRRKLYYAMRHGIPQNFLDAYKKRLQHKNETRNFYSLLSYLREQGFIKQEKIKGETVIKITLDGKRKLNVLYEHMQNWKIGESDGRLRIVIFDIPESRKNDRKWLRSALRTCGFTLLQKSVWTGKRKLPVEFITALQERGLLSFIQILEITRSGIVRELTKHPQF